MFFDEDRRDDLYPRLLLSIARTQRELLECRFNWREKKTVPQQKTGFFSRKKSDPKYDNLLAKLEDLKLQTQRHRREMGYGNGVFWWNLPWAQLEDYLIYDLTQEDEVGSWRFQRTWKTQQIEHGTLLLLHEEGHFSSFASSTNYETGIISSYSEAEVNEKMRDYDRMVNSYNMALWFDIGDRKVRSSRTGVLYDSAAEYLFSAEHLLAQDFGRHMYARSLYTEKETTTLTVHSNSRHYEAVYAVAEFLLEGSGVQGLMIHNYGLCGARGDMPESVRELYASKDAAVGCAAYLADCSDVKSVPLKLFGSDMKSGVVSFQDAVRQAEIFTCLAEKIIL